MGNQSRLLAGGGTQARSGSLAGTWRCGDKCKDSLSLGNSLSKGSTEVNLRQGSWGHGGAWIAWSTLWKGSCGSRGCKGRLWLMEQRGRTLNSSLSHFSESPWQRLGKKVLELRKVGVSGEKCARRIRMGGKHLSRVSGKEEEEVISLSKDRDEMEA